MEKSANSQTREKARAIVAGVLTGIVPVEKITDTAQFIDLGVDSLDKIEVMFALEEHFHIDISDDAIEGLKTVGDMLSYVERATA